MFERLLYFKIFCYLGDWIVSKRKDEFIRNQLQDSLKYHVLSDSSKVNGWPLDQGWVFNPASARFITAPLISSRNTDRMILADMSK